jgi:hypothetical protein
MHFLGRNWRNVQKTRLFRVFGALRIFRAFERRKPTPIPLASKYFYARVGQPFERSGIGKLHTCQNINTYDRRF